MLILFQEKHTIKRFMVKYFIGFVGLASIVFHQTSVVLSGLSVFQRQITLENSRSGSADDFWKNLNNCRNFRWT